MTKRLFLLMVAIVTLLGTAAPVAAGCAYFASHSDHGMGRLFGGNDVLGGSVRGFGCVSSLCHYAFDRGDGYMAIVSSYQIDCQIEMFTV